MLAYHTTSTKTKRGVVSHYKLSWNASTYTHKYALKFKTTTTTTALCVIFYSCVGVLLRKLESGLVGISHVIVDEIHERDINVCCHFFTSYYYYYYYYYVLYFVLLLLLLLVVVVVLYLNVSAPDSVISVCVHISSP